ncbi:LppP/LprE family lipoprotein [Agreia pratensis]|uniref:LppP/LprE lipoprotein n=1 Tax=Agreia pratensis TaxID=150121 RepID=A0A1X7IUL4_9MICO|nr:LppP/LprE family lipoprotein [Agreia pratensis]SMG18867.1 LppP/LprE lipoprotein [Agreia pratensis]
MMKETKAQQRSPRAVGRASTGLALTALVAALAAGCATTTDPGPTAAAPAPSSSENTAATPTPSPDACGPATAQEAAAAGIAALPAPAGLESSRWDAANADYSGYDPCAALSWSVVTLEFATVSSPAAILLFHDGVYLGTATEKAYGFTPAVERTADNSISVTYRFNQGMESNTEASGRAVATYTWNAATDSVEMVGDVPPTG